MGYDPPVLPPRGCTTHLGVSTLGKRSPPAARLKGRHRTRSILSSFAPHNRDDYSSSMCAQDLCLLPISHTLCSLIDLAPFRRAAAVWVGPAG